jgi:hypothetical protein
VYHNGAPDCWFLLERANNTEEPSVAWSSNGRTVPSRGAWHEPAATR